MGPEFAAHGLRHFAKGKLTACVNSGLAIDSAPMRLLVVLFRNKSSDRRAANACYETPVYM